MNHGVGGWNNESLTMITNLPTNLCLRDHQPSAYITCNHRGGMQRNTKTVPSEPKGTRFWADYNFSTCHPCIFSKGPATVRNLKAAESDEKGPPDQ